MKTLLTVRVGVGVAAGVKAALVLIPAGTFLGD